MHEFFENDDRPKFRVFISGQKYFGEKVLSLCLTMGLEVVGVCCPVGDQYIGKLAAAWGVPIIPAGMLKPEHILDGTDLGITAHSFDYVGKLSRYRPKYGWIGYHPSLLPRHRGRSSIEWAIRMRDFITGGSIYWLNSGIDRGDIERQKAVWVDPKYFNMDPAKAASEFWRAELFGLGVELFKEAITDISNGKINKTPQDKRFSTWEPNTEVKDIYRPDLLMLPPVSTPKKQNGIQ